MNLHVNLILATERRSGSDVSLKFLLRVALILLATLLVMGATALALGARGARRERLAVESQKQDIDPIYKSVLQARGELNKLKPLVDLLDGWQTNRLGLSRYLRELQATVPAKLQLTRLTLQNNLDAAGSPPGWVGSVYLRGRAAGQAADADVRSLNRCLNTLPYFDALMEQAEVKRFAADEEQTGEDVRVFEIEGRFVRRPVVLTR